MKSTPVAKKKKPYLLSLAIADTSFKASGETIEQALQSLEQPIEIGADGLLTVAHDNKKAEVYLTPHRIRRLYYPMSQIYVADELNLILNAA